MPNSVFEELVKRRKKGGVGKLKLNGLPGNIATNMTTHDVFTVLLIVAAIIMVFIL